VRVSLRQWTYVGDDCVAGGDQERFKLNSVLLLLLRVDCAMILLLLSPRRAAILYIQSA
jgi:hypothetical protein